MDNNKSNISEKQFEEALAQTSFFSKLDSKSISFLAKQFSPQFIESETILMKEGEEGDNLYFILNGRLRVIKNFDKDNEEIVREVGFGELIGEFAMLTGEKRTATVVATRDTHLLQLSKESFLKFVETHPLELLEIAKHSILRLINPKKPSKNNFSTIVIVPAGDDHITFRSFSQKLAAELEKVSTTGHINSLNLPNNVKENQSELARWLNDQEYQHQFTIYETDTTITPWTKFCLRQADLVVTVAIAKSDSNCNEVEKYVYAKDKVVQKNVDLVLVHPDSTVLPQGVEKWLNKRKVRQNYNIKENSSEDYARLSRCFTGRAIGLVLSGGGGRGVAHIGFYNAMKELGIPIDYVAGVSAGAVMAALFAGKKSYKEMYEMCKKFLAENKKFFDYTFPFSAILRGGSWRYVLENMFGRETAIEDLWIPYFCVSTNITQNRPEVHQRGLVWKSIRASLALPAITPPVSTEEGDLLIDGGIVNNMPVDIMQKVMGGGKVIAVSVSSRKKIQNMVFSEGEFSGWKHLFQRFNFWKKEKVKVPNISDIMFATVSVADSQHQIVMTQLADLFVQLEVQQFGMFDFKVLDELIKVGYQNGIAVLKPNLNNLVKKT